MKRAIEVIRNMPADQLAGIQCLYCMDTHECRICHGRKVLPQPDGASIRPIPCWNCKRNPGVCPMCDTKSD